MNLEEIIQRFAPHSKTGTGIKTVRPLPTGQQPRVINGMLQLLEYLHEQSKRIEQLEKRVDELEKHELGNE